MGKQLAIEGTKTKHHPDISEAAEVYRDIRDDRARMSREEHDAKTTLMMRMKKHGLEVYDDPDLGLRVTVETVEETVKVRSLKEDAAPSESSSDAKPAPEAPKSEPKRRSKPKGDGTRAHTDGTGPTEVSDPKKLIDLKDEGAPKKKTRKRGKKG